MKHRQAPNLWRLTDLKTVLDDQSEMVNYGDPYHWIPARPLGLDALTNRVKLAWGVFTGKYDAVKWPGGQ